MIQNVILPFLLCLVGLVVLGGKQLSADLNTTKKKMLVLGITFLTSIIAVLIGLHPIFAGFGLAIAYRVWVNLAKDKNKK